MKASLFAEDDDGDMFQEQGGMTSSLDVASPRIHLPGTQGRPSSKYLTHSPNTDFIPSQTVTILYLQTLTGLKC